MFRTHDSATRAPEAGRLFGFSGLLIIAVVIASELVVLSFIYQHNFVFECRVHGPAWFCAALSGGVLRTLVAIAAFSLLLAAKPKVRAEFRPRRSLAASWLALHAAGFLAILAPWAFLTDASSTLAFVAAIALWLTGLAAAAVGAALALAPFERWRNTARGLGPGALPVVAAACLAPEIAAAVQWAWKWPLVAEITFDATAGLLRLFEDDVIANPEIVQLGIGEFLVLVGRQCSGVEGFALIGGFVAGYLVLFRDRLRFPHALILLPIGICLSWCFNVTRIAVLVMIGAHISPELAVNGFHSHAGWLMFTLLSVGLAMAAHSVPWFRSNMADENAATHSATPAAAVNPPAARPPFFQDSVVAQILPFAVFMASALLASTFVQTPAVVYPLRALAMIAVLGVLWRPILAMDWRIHWTALAAGGLIGVAWVLTAPGPGDSDQVLAAAVADLAGPAFVLWVAARLIGTTLLVPLIEELFFRGYVLDRMNIGGRLGLVLAVTVSTGLFALLHDRWLAAALAGLIFAALALRRGRLTDAIASHAIANGIIALHAVMAGDWHVI